MITIDEAIGFCEHNVGSVLMSEVLRSIAFYLRDYKRLLSEVPNKITKLYAIENIATGEIIFNARGGAYKKPEEAMAKLDKLEDGKYRLVTYELKGS